MMLPLKTVTVGANQFGGSPVTRTLALVLVLAVALPVVAFAAAVSAAGASNALISGGLSFFVVVGDRSKDVIVHLHYIMSSMDIKQNKSVLWAYKNKLLGFTRYVSHSVPCC